MATTAALSLASACASGGGPYDAISLVDDLHPVALDQTSGTTDDLHAVSAVTRDIVWAISRTGTFTVTTNAGETWRVGRIAGADTLDLRAVYGLSNVTAFVLSTGRGRRSQLLRTDDGGETWKLTYVNVDQPVEWKSVRFWNPLRGVAVGHGRSRELLTMSTRDGGVSWNRVPMLQLPPTLDTERAPADGAISFVSGRSGRAWLGTSQRRVMRSTGYGTKWKASFIPIKVDDTSGVVTLAFRDKDRGIAIGMPTSSPTDTVIAITADGGATWIERGPKPPIGVVLAAAYVPEISRMSVVAVGPNGAAYSRNNGATWTQINARAYNAVAFMGRKSGWAVGPGGRITKIEF
ncbi:MAG TPA: YCF48-related protein [Gemmatimonadaceae bacterium]|nr:YCF48-related protein [Gemmatimonadaceae bacterium]